MKLMLNVILMMLLAVVSNNVMAEWVKVYFDHTKTIYADFSAEQNEGNIVRMRSLANYDKTPQKTGTGIAYLSTIESGEYNCKEDKVRVLFISRYSKNMGGGKIVSRSSPFFTENWVQLTPDSIDHILWKHACGKNLSASQSG